MGLRGPLRKAALPLICSAGASDAAKELAARHSDYYLLLAEDPAIVAGHIADVKARAKALGRTDEIRFGLSVDVILRETDEQAFAEAKRVFEEGVRAGTVQMTADRSEQLSDTNKARYKRYNDREVNGFEDLFIAPNLWGGFGYVGIPPGFAFVGGYDSVEARIRAFADLGISMFFINGYPHLEEIYRLGEHVLPRFRAPPATAAANDPQPISLIAGGAAQARSNG
jgi:alkanesulfonate monooxygenase